MEVGYKAVAIYKGKLISIFDGSPWDLGVTRTEKVAWGHGGGFYTHKTPEDAWNADFPIGSKYPLLYVPRAILRCLCEGEMLEYKDNWAWYLNCKPLPSKYAYEKVTPVKIVELYLFHCFPTNSFDMEENNKGIEVGMIADNLPDYIQKSGLV
jgi:hypothetical protein